MWANIGVPSSDVPAKVDLLHMRIERHDCVALTCDHLNLVITVSADSVAQQVLCWLKCCETQVSSLWMTLNNISQIEWHFSWWLTKSCEAFQINPQLAKRRMKTNGLLANLALTSLVKEATGDGKPYAFPIGTTMFNWA